MASTGTRGAYGALPTKAPGEFVALGDDGAVRAVTGLSSKAKLLGAAFAAAAAVSAAVALGVTLTKSTEPDPARWCTWADYRLPPIATPSAYRIEWTPDFDAPFMFTAVTTIDVAVTQATSCLLLHASPELVVSAATFTLPGGAATPVASIGADTINERVVLQFPSALGAGTQVQVKLTASAPLGTTNTGLYLSQYTNDVGDTVNMVSTQFEATAARQAFPCFDEPAYKAAFTVQVANVPPSYTAVSNGRVVSTTPGANGTFTVLFEPSPKMSTYLVAIVVAPLISVTGQGGRFGNITATVYAVPRSTNQYQIQYALDVATKVLQVYEETFDVLYPLPKVDLLAIPSFAAGAMENWGCITFRETALLANESTSSASELQRVAVVVAHELAHQWFGDLVTMSWWGSLWLNEGYATITEYYGTNAFNPAFQIYAQFQSGDSLVAQRADAYSTTQSLTQPVDSSLAIESQFSSISYSKGGSLLLMLESFLNTALPGQDAYYRSIAAYLKKFSYGNASPDDLLDAFAAVTGIPQLRPWANTYTYNPGYAVVSLQWQDAASEATGRGVLVPSQQRHFFTPYSKSKASPTEASLLYWIPLTFKAEHPSADSAVPPAAAAYIASGGFTTVTGPAIGGGGAVYDIARDGALKANLNSTGYYRVNYPPSLWQALSASVTAQVYANASSPWSPEDRGELLDAIMTYAEGRIFAAQGINTTLGLQFMNFLTYDTSYQAWTVALYHMSWLSSVIVPDVPLAQAGNTAVSPFDSKPGAAACAANFAAYARRLLGEIVATLGFDGDQSPLSVLLRSSILNAASSFNNTAVVAQANLLWAGWPDAVPVNIASMVLNNAVRYGDASVWYAVRDLYLNELNAVTKRRYLGALPATRDRGLLQDTVDFAFNQVPVQDKVALLSGVAGNPYGRDILWAAITKPENWASLVTWYGGGGFDWSTVSSWGASFSSAEYVTAVESFYSSSSVPPSAVDFQQSLENIVARAEWTSAEYDATCAWLQQQPLA